MVQNFNALLAKRAADIFNVKNFDFFSKDVGDKIIPVVPILDCCLITRSAVLTNGTSQTLYGVPADRDFYLSSWTLSMIKDASATSLFVYIQAYVGGTAYSIGTIPLLAGVAQNQSFASGLMYPIKIDRGTAISVVSNSAVANISAGATIQGYLSESTPN